ncbi:cryptochrome-1 [Caerostris extrusa]|uniref:Cryptochrome-1 n=1 Tax=Caerostris extrusa TaxID=172846 RepID=A0AAV4Q4A9_CAEEX|nr:cryptochrome-1 [Caerostris extrusa]
MSKSHGNSIHWFRKCLRLHDNPAFVEAVKNGEYFWPIFILDPWFVKNMKVGPNRWRFLVQSLNNLDESLKKLNSRLFIIRGKPSEIFPDLVKKWKIKYLTFEIDTEPYAKIRDEKIENLMKSLNVEVTKFCTNTLYDPEQIIAFCDNSTLIEDDHEIKYNVPTLKELNVDESDLNPCLFPGGESEALRRLEQILPKEDYICKFEKPNTSPNSIIPSTTVLSPYVKFGCLSVRTFFFKIREIYLKSKKGYSKPPVSLHGQLFWREFFYTVGSATINFDQMVGNSVCTQIPWIENNVHLQAWAYAKTGYPFIDAIMTQLRNEGWIHHLARHAVACFLTRGDLWVSWEHGMKVFEELLLDADWSLNAGNWMWLSCSAFFINITAFIAQ